MRTKQATYKLQHPNFVPNWTKDGTLADYMELELVWRSKVRCIDGSERPEGWAINYHVIWRRCHSYSFATYPTPLEAITHAALDYCQYREHCAWEEWRDSQEWEWKHSAVQNEDGTVTLSRTLSPKES